jgi:AraC-like DNA-binding protein
VNETIYQDLAQNAIRFSVFTQMEGDTPFGGLGLKYVSSGVEVYYANNRKYTLRPGECLIGNDLTSTLVRINQPNPVQGLCIDIAPSIVSEVAQHHEAHLGNLQEFLLSDQFFVNKYAVGSTSLGHTLAVLNQRVKDGNFDIHQVQEELFYHLAECLICDQRLVLDHMSKMKFKREQTKQEVFRALWQARSIMEEDVRRNPSLEQICSEIGMSKYHFIRTFKQTFGVAPYQFLKQKRLEEARRELIMGLSTLDVALSFGYADVPTFSKAFKKAFGQTPGQIKK